MDTLIEAMMIEIKKDSRYLDFVVQEQRLQEVQVLLQQYQEANDKYQEVIKYQKHIDISQQRDTVKQLKQEVSNNPIIQQYYQSYHALNDLLDEVTKIVFEGISEEIDTSRYTI